MSRSRHIPVTLPFYDSTEKRDEARTGYFEPRHCPRTQLIPFQIQRAHSADTWIEDIWLVDRDGTETDIGDYFRNSIELITGGYSNGPGTLQSYDTLTVDNDNLHLTVVKTTTGAGDAGCETTTDFAVTEDERLYLEIDLVLTSGVAPKVVIIDAGDETTVLSNEVLLVNGSNYIVFTVTDTEATAALLFYNASAAATSFSCDTSVQTSLLTLTRTNRPTVYEFTSVDYIQYNGGSLVNSRSLIRTRAWTNAGYETFTSSDTAITSAIETGIQGYAVLPLYGDMKLEVDAKYTIYVPNVVLTSGQTPKIRLYNAASHSTPYQTLAAGDNKFEVTVTRSGGSDDIVYDGKLQVLNDAAASWSCGPVEVRRKYDPIPKGTYSLKLTDALNTWYSEWFCIEDIYENLISSVANASYQTFEADGTKVISAINTAGNTSAYGASGAFVCGEVVTIIFFLTINSGNAPYVLFQDTASGSTITNSTQSAAGVNAIDITFTKASSLARFVLNNNAVGNFSTSEIWIRRQYDSRFVKLDFSDSKDLRGERSDNETILYQNSFSQECWLKTIFNTPNQKRIDVGDEKDGIFISEKTSTQYLYRIVDYINRSLFEALIKLPQHDTVTITDEVGNEYSPAVGNINVSMEWDTFDTGTVTIEFNDGSFVRTENSTDLT